MRFAGRAEPDDWVDADFEADPDAARVDVVVIEEKLLLGVGGVVAVVDEREQSLQRLVDVRAVTGVVGIEVDEARGAPPDGCRRRDLNAMDGHVDTGIGEPQTITYVGYGGAGQDAQIQAWQVPYTQAHPNITFVNTSPPDVAQVKAQVEAGAVLWDVIATAPYAAEQNCGTLFEPLEIELTVPELVKAL